MGYERTLLERRQGIVGLLVRLRLVERDPNGDNGLAYTSVLFLGLNGQLWERLSHREGRLELRVPLDRRLHRKVVQLVCEHDTPDRIEAARGQVIDEQVVVVVNVGSGDVALPGAPVERVVLPHDRLQAKRSGDRTNAILHPREHVGLVSAFGR